MTPNIQTVNDYFDQTHSDYRRLWGIDRHLGLHCGFFDAVHRTHDAAVLNMNRMLADAARITSDDHVLDAGCGVGGSAIWLAENRGARVTGVNINQMQLGIAERLAERHRVQARTVFRRADYCATGFADATFDVVWALESLCYAEQKPAFLAEAHRLLKPGGRLVVADGFLTRNELSGKELRIVENWCRGWAIPNVVTVRQFQHSLQDAGFGDIEFQDATENVAPSSRRICRAAVLLYPFGLLLHWLGLRTKVQTRGIASGYYQSVARKKGLGVYLIFSAEKQAPSGSAQKLPQLRPQT